MIDPNLDPEVEAELRSFLASSADLSTATRQLENLSLSDIVQPVQVDEHLMNSLAAEPDASPRLREYAAQVAAGRCAWSDIEARLAPGLPPEVVALKSAPGYAWPWGTKEPDPPPTPAFDPAMTRPIPPPQAPSVRPRREPDVVGPSDWPDEFDDYPTQRNWLV
ncbi:hypothetical protein [Nocardia sp. NPDC003345]